MDARLNRLAVALPSDTEIVMTRSFGAPAQLVFEAMTKPEHVARWWGCAEGTDSTFDIDLRVGGKWRYVLRMGGQEHAFSGEYIEIVPPVLVISTERYEPFAEHDYVVTLTLDESGGRTLMTSHIRHKTKEGRDGHLQSGMEQGAAKTFDRLEDLLGELEAVASC